jgi:hypothetical protein
MSNDTTTENKGPVPAARSPDPPAQLPLHTSAEACPSIPAGKEDDLAQALMLSQLSSDDSDDYDDFDDFDEQVTGPHPMESAMTSKQALPCESDEDDLELALNMSLLPADIFDELAIEIDRQKGSHTADENLASMAAGISPSEVCTASSFSSDKTLKFGPEHAGHIGGPTGLGAW